MCGIAGCLLGGPAGPREEAAVRIMMGRLVHRGPDAEGLHRDGPAVLGHRRLSIVDLRPEASQPMLNEDGQVALVINGEIYNFRELRRDLEARGHCFRSRSDSEVVLHLYEDVGLDFVSRLRGMFALALWDAPRQRLVLARDRFGKKPLLYHFGTRGLWFASELQALLAADLFPREIDLDAVDAYLALQYVPAPMCAFRGVRKLEPGHLMVCRPGEEPTPRRYYFLTFEPVASLTLAEAAEGLRRRLEEAVRVRLVADVPLGAFLSGGVDSTAVVALMTRVSSERVRTFTIGFPAQDESEIPYARMAAKRLGTEHHDLVVEPDMVSILDEIVGHYGEPFADTSAIPTWYLCRFTRQFVTVALSGDAGDENFAGYNRYRYAALARTLASLPRPLPRLVSAALASLPVPQWQPAREFGRTLLSGEVARYLGLVAHFPHPERWRLYHPDLRSRFERDRIADHFASLLASATAQDPTGRLMELDFCTYLPDDILVKVDIASMAHALEVRCPLLDQDVVEFAASIPTHLKMRGWTTKRIFRHAVADLVPREVLSRRKKGFSLPVDRWLREDLREMVRDHLLSSRLKDRGIFDHASIGRLLQQHDRGAPLGLRIWNLLMLEVWFRKFVDVPGKTS